MAIYTIGDLHLAFSENKPMDIFGQQWEKHDEKIKNDWLKKVKENDLVIIPGDFSWAMHLKDTYEDFKYLSELPGKKLLLKGNHDYWWTTLASMRNYLKENNFENIDFIYNNAYLFENKIITGTRGWNLIDPDNKTTEKMMNREKLRLELSIKDGIDKYGDDKEIITFIHYPPIIKNENNKYKNEFIKIMLQYGVKKCYYGHLHGITSGEVIEGKHNEIEFKLISADYLDFKLEKVE